MGASSEFEAKVREAADYVRRHPGCIQSNVIEAIMEGRSYGYARRRVQTALQAGYIVGRRDGNHLYLYPPDEPSASGGQ